MSYPTEQEVKDASREQLCAWWRFLPSPGMAAIGQPDFNEVMLAEAKIMGGHSAMVMVDGVAGGVCLESVKPL